MTHRLTTAGRRGGFSLVETTLALAIIATALIALLGVLPAGAETASRAVHATIVTNILDSLHHRLQGEPLTPRQGNALSFSPALFDGEGIYLPPDAPAADLARAVYRADLTLSDFAERPANTSSLRAVTIAIGWPVNPTTGELPPAARNRAVVSYPVTALTGPDWTEIARAYTADPSFTPKIGF